MNAYDSEVIEDILCNIGYSKAISSDESDIIVLNTCCIRDNADQKIYGRLWEYRKLKEKKPDIIIAVLGCLAQKDKEALLKKFPHVNIVLGPSNLKDLEDSINEISQRKKDKASNFDLDDSSWQLNAKRKSTISALIPISTGCNCNCSYCIVPSVRGRLRSIPFDTIIKRAEESARKGYKEIMLLGQNVNNYGQDLNENINFVSILKKVNEIDGIERIRFMSPNPRDFKNEYIDEITELKKVCPHIHLPLQSGDDNILSKMNRGYDTERYYDIVLRLRDKIPHIAITTDVIVGYPGETRQEFENTLKFYDKVKFDSAFMFCYSPRTGTRSSLVTENLTVEEKLKRLYELTELQTEISIENNRKYKNRILEVITEEVSKKDPEKLSGRSSCHKKVVFNGNSKLLGKTVCVKVEKTFSWGFEGKLTD